MQISIKQFEVDNQTCTIFDYLVDRPFVDDIFKGVINQNIWKFGWHSTKTNPEYRFWNVKFVGSKNKPMTELGWADFVSKWGPVASLWDVFKQLAVQGLQLNLDLQRSYANGYTYGTGGSIHRDDGEWTVLYYATSPWNYNWNGATAFYDNDRQLIQTVQYIPGRFVIFPAKIWHSAMDVTKTCNELRSIIAFKCMTSK